MPDVGDEPPPYNNSPFIQRSIPEVTVPNNSSVEAVSESPTESRPPPVENGGEDAPSYTATVTDDVLPSYNEATSSEFGLATIKLEDEEDDNVIAGESV